MISIIVFTLLGLIGGLILYVFTDSVLPTGTEKAIEEIASKGFPELVTGATGYAKSNSINIWYEKKSSSAKTRGTILLISGLTSTATFWHQNFIQSLLDLGYEIIRFDNRSVGLSDWIKNWKDNPYSTEDMVNDAIEVLNKNNIEKAHVIGFSLGGFLGQRLAIKCPERVLTLTSLSSTADFNEVGHQKVNWSIPIAVIRLFLRSVIVPNDRNYLKFLFKFFDHVNGVNSKPLELNLLGERGLYELHKRRGLNPSARKHQMTAMRTSQPTYEQLDKLKIPTLVAHGENDPILSFELAKKYANKLSGSKQVWIERTGHVMTDYYIDKIAPDLIGVLEKGRQRDANEPQQEL